MDKNHYFQQEINNSLGMILYNCRAASNPEQILKTMKIISQLCQRNAEINIIPVRCKLCKDKIKGRDEEIIEQYCKCKSQTQEIFHKKCFLQYCMIYTESQFNCQNQQCYQNQQNQIMQCYKQLDYLCKLCNKKLSNKEEESVKTGCECPFKRVHKECIRKNYANCRFKQHQLKCEDCQSYYREQTIINIIQDYEYGCLRCPEQHSNHVYWNLVPIDCEPYRVCRGCFEINTNFEDTPMNQIKCIHERDCQAFLSFHTLNQFFFKIEKVVNRYKAEEMLQTQQIDLKNYFKLAECPGSLYTLHKYDFKILQQQDITSFINYSTLLNENELSQEEQGKQWVFEKCKNIFEVNLNNKMQRCSNCNYKFCADCNIAHFGIPCTTYNRYKNIFQVTDDFLLQVSQYGLNTQDINGVLKDLQLNLELFNFDVISNPLQMMKNLKLYNQQYNFNYPNQQFQTAIQLRVEALYGQKAEAFNDWLYMYLPIQSMRHLRQCILCGIESNLPNEIAEMEDRYSGKIIQQGSVLYSEYEYAFDQSSLIYLASEQNNYMKQQQIPIKAILLCKVDGKYVKNPKSYRSLFVCNQSVNNPTIIAYQIVVFRYPQNN